MKLLLSPHCDDETLFASYIILRERPSVLICFNGRRARHLPRDFEREEETSAAMTILGAKVVFARVQCDPADWYELELAVRPVKPEHVWAPLPEPGGNLGHNGVGNLATMLWPDRVSYYTTYAGEANGRTEVGDLVISKPSWADKKVKALACYTSQRLKPDTAFHFRRPLMEYETSELLPQRGRRLNLGGGINPIQGFDNLDQKTNAETIEATTDDMIQTGWNFEDGLPQYEDGSVEAITISHTLMYVDQQYWPAIFSELLRVLEPGGILRVTEDAIGADGSKRPIIRPHAKVATDVDLVRRLMNQAGFDPHELSPNVSLFYDPSLIQQNYGDPPDVFHIEGIRP